MAIKIKSPGLATSVQDLDHHARVAVCVDNTHRQLASPIRRGSSQVIQHVQHRHTRLSAQRTIHA